MIAVPVAGEQLCYALAISLALTLTLPLLLVAQAFTKRMPVANSC